MEILKPPSEAARISYLDSLRGVAAAIVVVSHCWLAVGDAFRNAHRGIGNNLKTIYDFFFFSVGKIAELAHSSVIIFFVLSGFVLALSLEVKHVPYIQYLIRRFFRIYPALLTSLILAWSFHFLWKNQPVESSWVQDIAARTINGKVLLKNALLWGTHGSNDIDVVIWSLVHELRISVLFPLIFIFTRYSWKLAILIFATLSVGSSLIVLHQSGSVAIGIADNNVLISLECTLSFCIYFVIGACLGIHRHSIRDAITQWKLKPKLMFFAAIMICLLKSRMNIHEFQGAFSDALSGIGAAGLISLCLGWDRLSKELSKRFAVWLGRVSYSLYLIHVPILYLLLETTTLSVLSASLVTICFSLLAAEALARFVEFPANRFGRWIASPPKKA